MPLPWSQKNVLPIGVDFGHDRLKLLQVTPDDPPQLVAAASAEVPADSRRSADLYFRFVRDRLPALVREGRFKGRRVSASISANQSYIQHLRLPKAEGELFEQQVEAELRGRLPLPPSGLVIRHFVVGEVMAEGVVRQELICMAASRESIMRIVQVSRAVGLDVVGMHGEPMAVMAAFGHLFRRADDGERTTFFIDIGSAATKALIAHGDRVVFAKTIQVGGEHFVRQLAGRLKLEPAEARARWITAGASASSSPARRDEAAAMEPIPARRDRGGLRDNGSPVGQAVADRPARPAPGQEEDEMLEALVDELQLCIGYHASTFADRPIEKVIFLGGESRQKALCQRIARSLRLPAQLGDPLARLVKPAGAPAPVGVDLRHGQPGWAVPLGLCLLPTNL